MPSTEDVSSLSVFQHVLWQMIKEIVTLSTTKYVEEDALC